MRTSTFQRAELRLINRVVVTLTCTLLLLGGLVGCETTTEDPAIQYGNGAPLSAWQGVAGGVAVATGTSGTVGTLPTAGASGGGAGTVGTSGTAGITGTAGVTGTAGTFGTAGTSGTAGTFGTAGTGGTAGIPAAGTGGTAGTGSTNGLSSMTFTVLTKSQGGRYSPKNIGAIWVATSSGQFVKTLELWAFIRIQYLQKWAAETGSNRVDAVASATLTSHKTHQVTWDLTDANGNVVPEGAYKVIIEVTDKDAAGQFTAVDFTVGPTPTTVTPPDAQYFGSMQLSVQ